MKSLTWEKRIATATRRGYFTDRDHALACDWPHCAVGEALLSHAVEVADIVRYTTLYGKLHANGMQFARAVRWGEFEEAEVLREKIAKHVLSITKHKRPRLLSKPNKER